MEYKTLSVQKNDHIAVITFQNPAMLNALTPAFLEEYGHLLDELQRVPDISVVIVTGEGKAFIAGADISAMVSMGPVSATNYADQTSRLYHHMETSDKIFIAAINGYTLGGGCEFALACDLRIASSKAKFGFPEVSLGIFPGAGGTQRLPRLIGMAKAKELVYTGETITADEALHTGLVSCVVAPEELLNKANDIAKRILSNSRYAVSMSKKAFYQGAQMTLPSATELEKDLFSLCFDYPDQKEGMAAFQEKRKPHFQ